MDSSTLTPAPPLQPGLSWRELTSADLPALIEFAQAGLHTDGGLPFLFAPEAVQDRFLPNLPGARIGAFDTERRLGAVAAICADGGASTPRATLVGGVRLDLRRRGLGAYLVRWGQAQASPLLAPAGERRSILRVATESLTDSAHRLYLAHGYACVFEELVMRRDLRQPLPGPALPDGVVLATWQPETAGHFFQAYHAAFQERPGFPGYSADEWICGVNGNDLVAEWTLLARAGDAPLGFVIGALDLTADPPGGYVVQIGVVPAARRRGLASALMVEALRRMQAAGAPCADLTVHLNNPGAIAAYTGLGFIPIGRRARYERIVEPS
jgi:ribosomal protein S18 acetylase RimI-like enzyme